MYTIMQILGEQPDADIAEITKSVLADTIAETTRLSTQSLLNANMSAKSIAKRPDTNALRFDSIEEANKANIPVGATVIIDGVEYVMEAE